MLISFLKKENDDGEQSKFMGKGDIIFLLVLAAIISGIWFYYKSTKEETYGHYVKCESLYFADNLGKAKECYEEDALKLNYRTDSLDSIGSNRIEKIENILAGDTLFKADSIKEAKKCYERAMKLGADSIVNNRMGRTKLDQ